MSNSGGISLTKGQTINLTKVNQQISLQKGGSGGDLKQLHVGLGWDVHSRVQADLDAFVVQLDSEDRLVDLIYFGQLKSKDGAVKHTGDNLTGEGDGDDEVIYIDLDNLKSNVHRLVVGVNIYQARLPFSDVKNAYVRILNRSNNEVLVQYNLSEDFGNTYTMSTGELIRSEDGTWDFRAVGEATKDSSISQFVGHISKGKANNSSSNNTPPSNNGGEQRRGGFFGRLFGGN